MRLCDQSSVSTGADTGAEGEVLMLHFFVRILEGRYLDRAGRSRGKCRSLFLGSCRFLLPIGRIVPSHKNAEPATILPNRLRRVALPLSHRVVACLNDQDLQHGAISRSSKSPSSASPANHTLHCFRQWP